MCKHYPIIRLALCLLLAALLPGVPRMAQADAAAPYMVKDIDAYTVGSQPAYLTDVGGTLFFTANDGTNGYELWKSDGTQAGTVLVKDIWPGSLPSSPWSSRSDLTNVNGTLFFVAADGVHGSELWKSDGTEAGTVLVKDIWPGSDPSSCYSGPSSLTNVNGTLFFIANDGTHGYELWKSDGTRPAPSWSRTSTPVAARTCST